MTFIIAEMSGNHGGSLERAKQLITKAKECGCDAIKIQTYDVEDLCDPKNNEIYLQCRIPRDWYPKLFAHAKEAGIILFSSVFAPWAVDFLAQFEPWWIKIASPESTRLLPRTYQEILDKCAGLVVFASTGRRDLAFIQKLKPSKLLYCVKGYPADVTDTDIDFFVANHFDGLSDHSADIKTPLAFMQAGAKTIEKHFKLDDDCIDAAFSLNPAQMATLCRLAHR